MIVTFYNEKINPEIVKHQKMVFDFFGHNLNQINVENWVSHGKSIDDFLSSITNENEVICLFDIDCIPLNSKIITESLLWCGENIGIFSIAQKAANIKNPIIHASPAFMVFSKKTYDYLNKPTFQETERSDCGGEMTHIAREKGVEIRMLYPNHVEVPVWELDSYIKFGYGTTYENKIFHSFESRFGNEKLNSIFIKKCREVLNG